MSEGKKSTERKFGGETAMGDAAAKRAFDKYYGKTDRQDLLDRMVSARNEADNEFKREMTRVASKTRSARKDRR